ncbi:putative ABC transport system permease protein [Mucilaginibacter pineti]|uniref:Putative ABC transport system permease protein n=1 Tax=Mucilaginibacter pineti TaxID=1391627 RepID=A0A1G6U0M8_9SPHI|nr:ABC transporter permease [Mucilaginibacter pineti]SDD34871.1 putative ABC transport system permease protein [Mucilaginibacter pineti]
MFKNYLQVIWRNLARNKAFSFINISGLAIGLASFIIILLYLNYQLSYDQWSPELKKVYRVSMKEGDDFSDRTPAPLSALLVQKYPNAEAATALQSAGDFEILLSAGDKKIYQKNIVTVDSNFLKVFPYQLTKGDALTALNKPNAILITEELSKKLFGDADPIGQPVKVYNAVNCMVTGVIKKPAGPAHMPVEMLMRDPYGKQNNFWGNLSFQTYIKVRHTETDARIENTINRIFYSERLKKDNRSFEAYQRSAQATSLFIDAVPSIYNFPKHGSSNFTVASVLLALAVLLLLAGAINFSNLSIAQSMKRAKEVGVRKVLGSARGQLVVQFMMETGVQCLISLSIAILLVYISLPYINSSFNLQLGFWHKDGSASLVIQIALCLLIVTLLSGLYPSLFLSRYNTTNVLKGDYSSGTKGTLLRNVLIVVQFMVAVFFITAIIAIRSQMLYMQSRDKGFSGEQVMRIQAGQQTRENGFESMRQAMLRLPGVSYVAKTTKVPGDHLFTDTSTVGFKYSGTIYRMASVKISKDYFNTLQIPLMQGRGFTDAPPDQNTRSAILNESAVKKLKLSDPVGKTIFFPSCDSIPVQVVGVVKDFHEFGFEMAVQPEVYTMGNQACMFQSGGGIIVKINGKQLQSSVVAIEKAWKTIEPEFPIRYSFVDDNFQLLFNSYSQLQTIITFFGIVALVISIVGLFALTAFFTRQRTKEIGVRKVLGASVVQLTALLSWQFVYLVGISILLTTPIAWWAVHKWLQTFVYRIETSWWMFLVSGITALLIAVITISFQSIKAALANPVKSLRSE